MVEPVPMKEQGCEVRAAPEKLKTSDYEQEFTINQHIEPLLENINASTYSIVSDSVISLFEQQVQLTPDNIAVFFEG